MYKKRTPFIFPFTDGLGVERFRVEFICESAAEATAVAERGCSAPMAAAFQPAEPVLNQATNVAESATPEGVLTAGEFQATRQHEAAEGGEQSPCIGSICSVGE